MTNPRRPEDPAIGGVDRRAGKYLTFVVAGEDYGVEILRVREIIGVMPCTAVPGMPDYVDGVINLRGKVLPVIDLRRKFGLPDREHTAETCVIVVEVRRQLVGVVVDHVSEVLNVYAEDIEDAPELGQSVGARFILGLAKAKGRVKILLDIECVLTEIAVEVPGDSSRS